MLIKYILFFTVLLSFSLKAESDTYTFHLKDNEKNSLFTFESESGSYYQDKENLLNSRIEFLFGVNNSSSFDFEIVKTKNFDIDQINQNIEYSKTNLFEVVDIGIYRGVHLKKIIIKPFYFDNLTNSVQVVTEGEIIHNIEIKNKRRKISLRNYQFIANVRQLPFLTNENNSPTFLEGYSTLDMDINYLKISTKADRIYKISFAEIFQKLPELSGKNKRNIKMINRGENIPVFVRSDDETLSSDDYLYFYGKHRRSDSTYYNFYGIEEAYFLFYDENNEGKRYIESDIQGNYGELESVKATYHYEKDSIYIYYRLDTEQYDNEGWYWGEVFPDEKYTAKSEFSPKLFISPSVNINDNIRIKAYYKSYNDIAYSSSDTKHTYNIDLIINQNEYDNEIFDGFKHGFLNAYLNNESLLYGLNEIKIKANVRNPQIDNYTGIDYFEVSGDMKPQAVDGRLNFSYVSDKIRGITIPNFVNSEVVAVIQNEIFFPDLIQGFNFNIGAIANRGMSVGINDEFIYNIEPGVYLIAQNGNDFIKLNSKDNENNVINAMNSLPDNSPFIFLAYQVTSINNFNSILNNFEAQNYSGFKAGDIYAFAGIKGTQNKIEQINANSINISKFFENSFSGFATAVFNVPSIFIGSYFISNIAESDDYELISVSNNNLYEAQDVDYLIISHQEFESGIKKLADFRHDWMGVNYKIVNTEDIYNQFGDGIKSPFAIKNYISYVYHNYQEPVVSDVLLVGDASWDPRKNLKVSLAENFLPSYGMPVSDYWYVTVDGDDLLPDINIGRLPANNDIELQNMISKIITHDTVQVKSWMKEMLFLSGGISEDDIRRYRNRIPWVKDDILEPAPMGGKGTTIIRSAANASGEENAGEIRKEINEGKFWTNFLGHASSEIFDMDGWQVETLNNNKRFGVLSTLSCNTGAFAEPPLKSSRNETYVKAKDKGFVATISGTATGYVQYQWDILEDMARAFADSTLKYRRIGDILTYAKIKSNNPENPYRIHTVYQMTILGDPLTSLRLDENTDLFLDGNEIAYFNEDGEEIFSEDNEVINITGFVNNNGYCTDDTVELKIMRYVETHNYRDTLLIKYDGLCFNREFGIELPILNMDGIHRIELLVDPENIVNDTKRYNNTYSVDVNVLSQSLIVLEPKEAGIINKDEPVFRIIDPLNIGNDKINYEFYITEQKYSDDYLISSKTNEIDIYSTHIDWKPDLSNLQAGKDYWLKAGYSSEGSFAKWSYSNFTIENGFITEGDKWLLKYSNQFAEFLDEESINIDIDKYDIVSLNSDTIPYKIISHIGNYNTNPNIRSLINMEIGDEVYTSGEYYIGFNIITLPVDISKGKGKYRRFDTWGNDDTYGKDFWKDSSAVRLVEFLEDSVANDEYLFLSTSRPSFRLLRLHYENQPESKGNLDSLINALKLYGATLADSLNNDLVRTDTSTYQLISRPGYDEPIEKLIYTRDSLVTEDNIIRHNFKGTIITDKIGPARKWTSLQIDGDFSDDSYGLIHIIGINGFAEDTLITNNEFNEINLESINSGEYKFIRIAIDIEVNKIVFEGFDNIDKPEITSINLKYEPLPEIAVIPENIYLTKDSVLTGEHTAVNYSLRNLSLRSDADKTEYMITANKEKGELFYENYHRMPKFPSDSIINNTMDIATEDIDLINTIRGDLHSVNDIYPFNNSFSTKLYQIIDGVKPYIRIKSDGKYITSGDYISAKPLIEIELYDNAFFNITDSTKISARLNGYFHPGQRTEYSDFRTVEDSTLKAVYTFRPDTIEYEDILLFAYVADASNNRDTLRLTLKTTLRNNIIEDVLSVPNPFSETTDIRFLLKTPKPEADAIVHIYDAIGNLIRIIEDKVSPGYNDIRWDGKLDNGAESPIGMYYFKINIYNAGYVEPVNGKVVKVK